MAKHPNTAERELPREAVDVVKAAARIRHKLTKDWYTAGQVGAVLGFSGKDAKPNAAWLHRQGKLLGVRVPIEHAYRFPTWQFAGNAPVPEIQPILRLLPEHQIRKRCWNAARPMISEADTS